MTWQERAQRVLLNNCNTMSKRVQAYVEDVYASHVVTSYGHNLKMSDGRWLLDTVSGLGSCLVETKNNYGLECVESVELAEAILERIPYHHKLKFLKTGSAACGAAIRYARAYTGRSCVAYSGYHGGENVFVNCTPPALGTVYEMSQKFDTMDHLTDFVESRPGLAAVIVEPLELDTHGMVDRLTRLRDACDKDGCLLIYDEIITGWRTPGFTVANYTAVYPDITVLGKALGATYSLGVIAVTDKIAEATQGVFVSNTSNGEKNVMAAALYLVRSVTNEQIEDMWRLSWGFWMDMCMCSHLCSLKGWPGRYVWVAEETTKALVWQQMYKYGVFVGAALFPKLSWDGKVYAKIYSAYKKAIQDIEKGVKLDGKAIRPYFIR